MQKSFSVVVPVHNALPLTLACLASLRSQKKIKEIVIIDDGSDREVGEVLKGMEGISVYHNAGAEGFIASVNRGVKKSNEDYLLILNSDTVAQPNAVEQLAESLDQGYAMAGARLVFPPTYPYPQMRLTIQHYAIGFNVMGIPYHPYMNYPGDEPCVMIKRDVNAVTGAALAITREWWDKMGGLDTKYGVGVFDDADLCLSVRKAGGHIQANPNAVFYHWQHGSQDPNGGWFNANNINTNLSILMAKHGKPVCDDSIYFRMS
jgi:O-antigen biosynthesis protein